MRNLKLLGQITAIACGSLAFVGCTGMHHDTYSTSSGYSSTTAATPITEGSGAQTGSSYSSQQSSQSSESGWQPGPHIRAAREQHLEQSSAQQGSSQESASSASQSQQAQMSQDHMVIPLYREQLNVGKQTVDAGQVTIRKIVTTETVSQPVELRRESIVIERQPAQGQTASSSKAGFQESAGASREGSAESVAGAPFQEKTITIPLKQEKPVVQKSVVQSGQVVIDRNAQNQQQTVQDQVRREDVQIDKGNAANVDIRGNFSSASQPASEQPASEPAGSERK